VTLTEAKESYAL